MKEIRCNCGSLLLKADIKEGMVEIKCKKCKEIKRIIVPFQERIVLIKK